MRYRFFLTALSAFMLGGTQLPAQQLDEVAETFQQDLNAALTELSELRERIAEDRVPLVQKRDQMEKAVRDKRVERDRLDRSSENELVDLNALKTEVTGLTTENNYLSGLLNDYMRTFETQIHVSEADLFDPMIADVQAALSNEDLSLKQRAEKQLELIAASFGRVERLIGGDTFEGQALSPDGKLESGTFALIGPVAVFAGSQSGAAGLAQLQLGSPEPTVIALGPETVSGIQSITSTGTGNLPVDTTGGNALKIAATEDTLIQHMSKGGPVMVPIVAFGIVAFLTAILKWVQLSRIRTASPTDLNLILSHIRAGHPEKALAHAKEIKGYIGEMMKDAVRNAREKKEYLEEIMYEKMLSARPKLEKYLPIITLAAATAPLLGLLGTVTGIINTFRMITVFGTGDPRTLSGGISEALITTEFGLIVAVPALILSAVISRKVKGVLGSMEQMTVGFINGLPDESEIAKNKIRSAENPGSGNEERVNYV